jgi:signal transduction histidine kinase
VAAGQELAGGMASFQASSMRALPLVRGDRIQLQQVLTNLLRNGIQAMTSVSDRPRELTIQSRQHDVNEVVVVVQDNGTGIDPDHFDRLFDAFFTTKSDGTGIGLSICRSIVEAHGGRIWASRNSGHGVAFHFALPAPVAAGWRTAGNNAHERCRPARTRDFPLENATTKVRRALFDSIQSKAL